MGDTIDDARSIALFHQFTDNKMMGNLLNHNGGNESLDLFSLRPGLRMQYMTVETQDD